MALFHSQTRHHVINIDRVSMDLRIHRSEFLNFDIFLSLKIVFILSNSADPDEVPLYHGLQSLPPSPKRAERKGRRRPFREAGSGHKQWNTVSCVDTFSIIKKFSS